LDIESNELVDVFYQPPTTYITSDNMKSLKIDDLFGFECCSLNNADLQVLRAVLFPEVKVIERYNEGTGDKIIKALDGDQEKFAKRVPYGHYMITGVPGSGKTVILIARAIFLVKNNPEWKIRIVTYNKALTQKIENKLNELEEHCNLMDIHLENISVTTFHKMALEFANVKVPNKIPTEWWEVSLPSIALEKATCVFDAILIDEYQDFYDDWIRLCVKVCKTYKYKNSKDEEVEGINLFMGGDRLQSIYNANDLSWKSLGIDMRGRSELLKKSYRTGKNHINLALDFLMLEPSLKKEVENFYDGRDDIDNDSDINSKIIFLEGKYNSVNTLLKGLLDKGNYKPKDIMVLCKTKKTCESLLSQLDNDIRNNTQVTKEPDDKHIILTTYHSSKGLEAPVCILIDVDEFSEKTIIENDIKERKLLYVGITRASEILYIHAKNYNSDSFARQLKELYNKK
jgi:superfamily I DNA and RNA helicase